MSRKYAQGKYTVENTEKYSGSKAPYFRSSWELAFMRMCDSHPNVLKWANEPVKIPYRNPATGKFTVYVPDFLIQYIDRNGKEHVELIEIKPSSQTTLENSRGKQDALHVAVNAAKWTAASEWCQRKGIRFKVVNEESIFHKPPPRNTRKRKK
jgi:hypothetical protein